MRLVRRRDLTAALRSTLLLEVELVSCGKEVGAMCSREGSAEERLISWTASLRRGREHMFHAH